MIAGTPPGTYHIQVRVTDSLFPQAVAISDIEIYVEELHKDAMSNALALRLKGLSTVSPQRKLNFSFQAVSFRQHSLNWISNGCCRSYKR